MCKFNGGDIVRMRHDDIGMWKKFTFKFIAVDPEDSEYGYGTQIKEHWLRRIKLSEYDLVEAAAKDSDTSHTAFKSGDIVREIGDPKNVSYIFIGYEYGQHHVFHAVDPKTDRNYWCQTKYFEHAPTNLSSVFLK